MPNQYENELIEDRRKLNEVLGSAPVEDIVSRWNETRPPTEYLLENWLRVKPLIDNWWRTYKRWESEDTWKDAFDEDRMSVRTFEGDFSKQRLKTVPDRGVRFNLGEDRFFADGAYTPVEDPKREQSRFDEKMGGTFRAQKGIDSSAFANPRNFASREAKYQAGLLDLSASLLKHGLSIFKQVHHKESPAFFSFVPLSKEEDQVVLYKLFRHSKGRMDHPIYNLVRGYRAEMTRVKLAQDFDMATGYAAIPVQRTAPQQPAAAAPTGIRAKMALFEKTGPTAEPPAFKVRFGLGSQTTLTGQKPENATKVTKEIHLARQADALSFRRILQTPHAIAVQSKLQEDGETGFKNEMVIALRHHAAGFPIHAFRPGGEPDVLRCFTIVGQDMRENNITISAVGEMNPPNKGTTPPKRWA